jgi:adenine-specific DNA methylase
MTVMFTHKRVDAWDTLGSALLDAGFSIDASWPIHTESEHSLHQARKNAAASTIFLTCKKRATSEPAFWSDLRRDVERAAEEAAERLAAQGISGVDLTIATYGPVLAVLSARWPVYTGELDEEGTSVLLRPDAALDLARERVASLKMRVSTVTEFPAPFVTEFPRPACTACSTRSCSPSRRRGRSPPAAHRRGPWR